MIRTLIVDDEPLSCSKIRRYLNSDPEIQVIGEYNTGKEAVRAIQQSRPDLVFLDVQMPGMGGFEVLRELGDGNIPNLIFVTAFDQYALAAFEFFPLGYLLKPFARARFEKTLRHAKEQLQNDGAKQLQALVAATMAKSQYIHRFTVKSPGKIFFLNSAEVEWIEAQGRFSILHTKKESHTLNESLGILEPKLDPKKFFRINRGAFVNADYIREIQPLLHGDYLVLMSDGKSLILSRRFRN